MAAVNGEAFCMDVVRKKPHHFLSRDFLSGLIWRVTWPGKWLQKATAPNILRGVRARLVSILLYDGNEQTQDIDFAEEVKSRRNGIIDG